MTTTKIRVTAEAWTRVSRSGHWTFFSSAQQEMKKAMTGLRLLLGLVGLLLGDGALAFALALLLLLLLGLAALGARGAGGGLEVGGAVVGAADVGAGRGGGLRGAPLGCLGAGLGLGVRVARLRVDVLAVVLGLGARPHDRLDLGDVAGDGGLGVLLGPLLFRALGLGAPRLAPLLRLLAAALLGLSLCPRLRHQPKRASAFPCAPCGGCTTGSTCASRCGRASFAATCSSRSCGACTPRRRGSRRFARLRPFAPTPIERKTPGPWARGRRQE